jgi:dihydroxynaphthoic acid synthetase
MSDVTYSDLIVTSDDGVATIVIDRPEVMNALYPTTIAELLEAFETAGDDPSIGVVILTGAGERAFCTGGDLNHWNSKGGYASASWTGIGLQVEKLHALIRALPKPVIAAVNGYAIGGGNVLQVVCDLSIASSTAVFGQVGPRVGSFDAGFGTAYLARLVGERRAREIWMLCRRYSAAEALEMGLVTAVVEPQQLLTEAQSWAREILGLSPSALKVVKASFNADSDHIAGLGSLAFAALSLYYGTDEAEEGHASLVARRSPEFQRFRAAPTAAQT